jgi:hypothetical protein
MLGELGRKLMALANTNATKITSYSGLGSGAGASSTRLGTLAEDDFAALEDKLELLRGLDIGVSSTSRLSYAGGSDTLRLGGDSSLIPRRQGFTGLRGMGSGIASALKGGAPRNLEAVQLLRLLQVVAEVSGEQLPDSWSWAKEWLLDVSGRKNEQRWQGEGLPIKEVRDLCAKLGVVVAKADDSSKAGVADDIIEVTGAGQESVDGQYVFSDYDSQGCAHYRKVDDDYYALYSEKNIHGDVRWVIAFLDPVLNGEPDALYRTNFTMTQKIESSFPPNQPKDWTAFGGREPSPSVVVVSGR